MKKLISAAGAAATIWLLPASAFADVIETFPGPTAPDVPATAEASVLALAVAVIAAAALVWRVVSKRK